MASALNDTAKNLMLDALDEASAIAYLGCHTADPGTSGTSEVTGGSPAYARKACVWNAAATGSKALNANVVFDIPAGSTVAYIGLWSAVSSGTFYGKIDVTDEVFAGQGQYTFLAAGASISVS
jgi:hypothetical protein